MTIEVESPREAATQRNDFTDSGFRRLLDNFLEGTRPLFCTSERAWNPPTDIFETKDSVCIKMELAGVSEGDIDIKVNNNFLVVRGRRKDEEHIKKDNYHLMEIQYGIFQRVFGFPRGMQLKDVSASRSNGFLMITVPKEAHVKEYRIEIE